MTGRMLSDSLSIATLGRPPSLSDPKGAIAERDEGVPWRSELDTRCSAVSHVQKTIEAALSDQ